MSDRAIRREQDSRLRFRPLTLRFREEQAERDFRMDHDEAAIPQQRIVSLVAIAFYAGFGLLDILVVTAGLENVFLIRFGIVCPFMTVGAVLYWTGWVRKHLATAQPGSCAGTVVAALGLDAIPLVASVPEDYSRTGTFLVLLFLFAFARIRFVWVIATTPLVVAGYVGVQVVENTPVNEAVYNDFFLMSFVAIGLFTAYTLERLRRLEYIRRLELASERQRSDNLLHNILPEDVAARLRNNPASIADSEAEVSVLFADIVGFTPFSSSLPPAEVVRLLDMLFNRFDDLCEEHGIEKIKTIGDAYMAVAGIPRPNPDHATAIVQLAFAMQRAAADLSPHWPAPLAMRIGIASGPVVAGVIGHKKFAYDLWGDTVNTASRMESHGRPNRIQVSEPTYELLRNDYAFSGPQVADIKGKGSMTTYYLLGPDISQAPTGDQKS